MQTKLLALAFALLQTAAVFSQKEAEAWGEIPPADLAMKVYPQDSSATAVVLQDVGEIEMVELNRQIIVHFRQHRRIKVFDPSAFKEGNLLIPYFSYEGLEKLKDLDVQIFLPNGERQKVKSDNVFTEKFNKYISAKKVFVPNLQKGCIIEYRFDLRLEHISMLQNWYFQGDLPTRWSELSVSILPYFEYITTTRSPRPFDVQETREAKRGTQVRYGFRHLPAIRKEPYMTTLDDYRTQIGFQLARMVFPKVDSFITTWTDLSKRMIKRWQGYEVDESFDAVWKDFSPLLAPEGEPEAVVAEKALRFVRERIKWNGDYLFAMSKRPEAVYAAKSGGSADLNLTLVALLQKAKLNAVPMMVSTRDNGATYPNYPFWGQFNSVVAFVRQGQNGLLLDATQDFLPPGQLRTEHYNGRGWLVDTLKPDWIELAPPEASTTWFGQLGLSETGEMSGQFSISVAGPVAAEWRKELADGTKEKDFLKKHFATTHADIAFDSINIAELTNLSKPLKINFSCRIPNAANAANDFIYCRPVLDFFVTENPFKSPKRSFPVDFAHPVKATYVLHLSLPPGYTVEELPEAARVALEADGGKISFTCTNQSPTVIQLQLRMNLAKTSFAPNEYSGLRQFFDLAAEKTQLQLVLKKN